MTERVASLEAYASKLYRLVDADAMRRIGRSAGFAGKDAGTRAVVETLGGDRAMSNFRNGRVRLGVGWDAGPTPNQVIIGHSPKGLWVLADEGRSASGTIYPRNGRRKGSRPLPGRAVRTPWGPRASSRFGPSRGTGLMRKAAGRERAVIPRAAFKALQLEIARVVGR